MTAPNKTQTDHSSVGLFPIVSAPPQKWQHLHQRAHRFFESRYWCAASTSALYEVFFNRLRYGVTLVDAMWTPQMSRLLKSSVHFEAHIHCPKASLVKAGLCFRRVVTPDEFKGAVSYIIEEHELTSAMSELALIVGAFDGNSPNHFVRIAHLFAAGALATTKSVAESEWRRFALPHVVAE